MNAQIIVGGGGGSVFWTGVAPNTFGLNRATEDTLHGPVHPRSTRDLSVFTSRKVEFIKNVTDEYFLFESVAHRSCQIRVGPAPEGAATIGPGRVMVRGSTAWLEKGVSIIPAAGDQG